MSLRRRRIEVEAQLLRVQSLRRRGETHADTVARRARALWPWFWLGSGALLGLAVERQMASAPRVRGRAVAWVGALPWRSLLPVFERALVAALLANRSAAPAPARGTPPHE